MPKPNIELSDEHWLIIKAILAKHLKGHEVWAFGSRAKFTAKPFSDLDIVVLNQTPLSIRTCAQLTEAFTESNLPWKVDFVQWNDLTPEFQQHIKADKVLIQPQETTNS